jgi:hypothetical protein
MNLAFEITDEDISRVLNAHGATSQLNNAQDAIDVETYQNRQKRTPLQRSRRSN